MTAKPSKKVLEAIKSEDMADLREAIESAPAAAGLGIRFTDLEGGRAAAELPPAPELENFLGFVHTGALYCLAEQVMAGAANSIGFVGLPLNCEMHFKKGADPALVTRAEARIVDTQGRIARVHVLLSQDDETIVELNEMVFLRSGDKI